MLAGCFITGTGLVTVQGLSVQENWQNLLSGRVLHGTGLVALDRDPGIARVSQLAIHAAMQALDDAGRPCLANDRVALIVGTSKGPIDDWIDQLNGHQPPRMSLGLSQVAVDVATAVNHCGGPRLTYAGACASGLHALVQAYQLTRNGVCDHALVVAAESSTHALFAANFRRLGVLADPTVGCKPFDQHRQGFLLAEAAAAVWIGSNQSNAVVEIEDGLAMADATHLTGIDRDGQTLRHILSRLVSQPIDMVHAHGTGTLLNDDVELSAIVDALPHASVPVPIYSHKHAIGHTQGAAGLTSIVLNVQMHRTGTVPGNSNTQSPAFSDATPQMLIDTKPNRRILNRSLAIAAGFGGTNAAVRLRSV